MQNLGRVLVIANPASRNGEGVRAADYVRAAYATLSPVEFEMRMTEAPGSAVGIAREASSFDTVLVVGGDGVIHEVVCGLMGLPRDTRPALGVIPCGNGNDYARTLGMGLNYREALSRLVSAEPRSTDVGLCNGMPFMQTLSFGLDAAIASGTHDRRKRTGRSGTRLFVEEGISQLLFHRDVYGFEYSIDGSMASRSEMLLFAIQVGPTYGGGFRICPDADSCDGLLDFCIARPPMGLAKAALLFLSAKDGRHARHAGDSLAFGKAASMRVKFDAPPPVQVDGETLTGTSFDVEIDPGALTVLYASERPSV